MLPQGQRACHQASCSSRQSAWHAGSVHSRCAGRRGAASLRAVERDLDWRPEGASPGPLMAPARGGGPPPPPPPPPMPSRAAWWEWPFVSRRNIALTMLTGAAGLWSLKRATSPVKFYDKPDIDFNLMGYTDLDPKDMVYFK
jgi:hypothetical protein